MTVFTGARVIVLVIIARVKIVSVSELGQGRWSSSANSHDQLELNWDNC